MEIWHLVWGYGSYPISIQMVWQIGLANSLGNGLGNRFGKWV